MPRMGRSHFCLARATYFRISFATFQLIVINHFRQIRGWMPLAAGCVHKGISSCFISRQCSVVYFIVVVKLELSQEEHPARKKIE